MKKRFTIRVVAIALCAVMSVFFSFGTAFAWSGQAEGSMFQWGSNPMFYSYNKGACTLRGSIADVYSDMRICNFTANSAPKSIFSRAAITKGDHLGREYVALGPTVVNTNGSNQGQILLSNYEETVSQVLGIGTVGVNSWGDGTVISGRTTYSVKSTNLNVLGMQSTMESAYYVLGSSCWASRSLDSAGWIPGSANFVGEDGRLYGVPYTGEDGDLVIPDMVRVKLGEDQFGYVSYEELNAATLGSADLGEEREIYLDDLMAQEAGAFQQAFSEYYGIDALSYESALECASEVRFDGGRERARQFMESEVRDELAYAIRSGEMVNDKALDALGQDVSGLVTDEVQDGTATARGSVEANDVLIAEHAFDAIYDLALARLTVSVPVYAEDGMTIIGSSDFVRF